MKKNNTQITGVEITKISQHPIHKFFNEDRESEYLDSSLKRSGGSWINSIVVVPDEDNDGCYKYISGGNRFKSYLKTGMKTIDVILYEITDVKLIKRLIIDLNKIKSKTGYEKYMEFIFECEANPARRNQAGHNRYKIIGDEIGLGEQSVKDCIELQNCFGNKGRILEKIFGNELSINKANQLKKIYKDYPDYFKNEQIFEKLLNPLFDLRKLVDVIDNLDIDNEVEFEFMKSYLSGEIDIIELKRRIGQLGKTIETLQDHENYRLSNLLPDLTEEYKGKNAFIMKGDNRYIDFKNPFNCEIAAIIGSPPYGIGEKRPDILGNKNEEVLDGEQTAVRFAETYNKYKIYLKEEGSIYVIIDDFRLKTGEFACSLEHFVIEMAKRGMYLIGRYTWKKNNPISKGHKTNGMVNGFEMIYRFSKMKKGYKSVDRMLIKNEIDGLIYQSGSTNPLKNGTTKRGEGYVQSTLKKVRNTLDNQTCIDYIEGNVANPEDWFRIKDTLDNTDETRHTSTTPTWLTTLLLMEATEKNDVVLDIWNGVGNSMSSSLLTMRRYIGVEREDTFYRQTCRRVIETEKMVEETYNSLKLNNHKLKAA